MNRESAIDFAPSELSFFDMLLSSCGDIQRKLEEERKSKKIDNPRHIDECVIVIDEIMFDNIYLIKEGFYR